ncbi:MAG: glycoside hydrolase family 127 protein [Oscillospiraceae bacterium]|jgi:hypothetical protein|nr:glycoside hydrolase family 127 protein [Oscillospiraceae bacterium]
MAWVLAVLVILAVPSVPAAAARAGNANYYSNQGALVADAFAALPLSAVRASGWLENQLLLQKNGLSGHMHLFNEYNAATSRWLRAASGEAWERGPYYMRGLVALAFTLDDETLKAEAMQWIEAILGSQRANGAFGPTSLGDWWPNMPVLMALRDYYGYTEYVGAPDARILPFMEAYFRYQLENLSRYRLTNWADARGGDNIDSVFWLYNRLYDAANPEDTAWLLNLGELLISQTNNWTDIYNTSTVRYHVVNTSQGLKTPAVYYQYNGDPAWRDAAANGILHWGIDHGRIDGLPNADEGARDNRATRGSETCGVVENLLSMEITERILGDAWIGDYIERVAYNALPATTTPDGTGHVYFIQQNQVLATLGNHEFDNDHGDSAAFGAPDGYDCCFSNYHMGWAKFVQSMWMATYDGGLAVTAYGPNQVTAKVADGRTARFVQETDYPFKDAVKLTYGGDEAAFALKLRIPAWAVRPVVKVNGAVCEGVVSGAYYTVNRVWTYGDVVDLVFPSEIKASTWYNNSVGIEKGALVYGLKIDEEWRRLDGTEGNDLREIKVPHKEDYPTREVFAASRWNYGLVIDYDDPAAGIAVEEAAQIPLQPFSAETPPVTLKATGQIIPAWTLDGNLTGPQPFITPYDGTLTEPVELIPYGSGRLRISQFPRIGAPSETVVRRDGYTVRHSGAVYTEFDNVVVPAADDYRLVVRGTGAGRVLVNSRYSEALDLSGGEAVVSGLKTKTSGSFQFRHEQLNNLRFTDGLTVSSIEVVLADRTIDDIVVSSVSRTAAGIRLSTNLSVQETPYRVVYGTEPGVYTTEVSSFAGAAAQITGLDPAATYYVRVRAAVNGTAKESKEYVLPPVPDGGALTPDPNAPEAVYGGFGTADDVRRDWTWISPGGSVSLPEGDPARIRFARSTNHKAYLNVAGAAQWTDYVAEVRLSLDDIERNNGGLMLRVTNPRDGADGYEGYFVGIGRFGTAPAGTSHVVIDYADGGWHDLKQAAQPIVPGQVYTLKVVARGERFAVYLDGALVTTFEDSRFASGTVGLRSYDEAFTVYGVTVRPVTQEDLRVFETPDEGPEPDPGAPDARYTGFGSAAAYRSEWQAYGSPQAIVPVEEDGRTRLAFGRDSDVKTVLVNAPQAEADPLTWTDYTAEAALSVTLADNNNAGLMIRTTGSGAGPDNYHGYFVGIGRVGEVNGTGVIIGYADGGWHTLKWIPWHIEAGRTYMLKAVAYGGTIAAFVDGVWAGAVRDARYTAGTIGLRSYKEAFTVHGVDVRPVTKEDLAWLAALAAPAFFDDFSDPAASEARWTAYGSTALVTMGGGVLQLGSSSNIKAVAGQADWSDCVYEADIRLVDDDNGNNAGLMVRVTGEASGADAYRGYYFGIRRDGIVVGRANNNWTSLAEPAHGAVKPIGQANHLKVVASGGELHYFVNGVLVYSVNDTQFAAGKIGLRGYNRKFTADNVTVRAISRQDLAEIAAQPVKEVAVTAASAGTIIQVKFPKVAGATTYKVAYGTQPGVYTEEIVDVATSGYAAGVITAGKTAFAAPAPGVCYLRFYALNNMSLAAVSQEVAVTTGYRETTERIAGQLAATLAEARAWDTSAYTGASAARWARAVAYADAVSLDPRANQMTLGLARQLLLCAAKPDSDEAAYAVFKASVEVSADGAGAAVAAFTVVNTDGGGDRAVRCLLAVYDARGRLTDLLQDEAVAGAGVYHHTLTADRPDGGSARAYLWERDTWAPLCEAGTLPA